MLHVHNKRIHLTETECSQDQTLSQSAMRTDDSQRPTGEFIKHNLTAKSDIIPLAFKMTQQNIADMRTRHVDA